jgi:hypothetical protein
MAQSFYRIFPPKSGALFSYLCIEGAMHGENKLEVMESWNICGLLWSAGQSAL